jgi:hypothetical protein
LIPELDTLRDVEQEFLRLARKHNSRRPVNSADVKSTYKGGFDVGYDLAYEHAMNHAAKCLEKFVKKELENG